MAIKLKIGDLVKIKSGGPVMTIRSIATDEKTLSCQWFSGSKLNDGWFAVDSIAPTSESDKNDE